MATKKIRITESQYSIIESGDYMQQNLFSDDKVTPEMEKKYYDKKKKNKEKNERNKEKRKERNEKNKKEMNNMHAIARGTGSDLFGNKYSKKEVEDAEQYIQSHKRKSKNKKENK